MQEPGTPILALKSILRFAGPVLVVVLASALLSFSAFAEDDTTNPTLPTLKMNGDVSLLSNYIDKGLTQTNQDPALQSNFGFNLGPQFKVGVFASNVYFNSFEHFLLALNAELKVVITPNADFKLGYYDNHYFRTLDRNGSITYLEVTIQGFRLHYEADSDWEGTSTRSSYYSFAKAFELGTYWKWDNQVGYSMLNAAGYNDYFDIRSVFFYKGAGNLTWEFGGTATSSPKQFNGAGDAMVLVGAMTTF